MNGHATETKPHDNAPACEQEAARLRFAQSEWKFGEGVNYLNHGSFGATPRTVQETRERLLREHAANPMDFFLRKMEPLLDEAAAVLGKFINAPAENLIFTPNSTAAMNIVAANIALQAGDEVLLNDHEYGAVSRLWGQVCKTAGAKTVLARLPTPLPSADEIVETLFQSVTPRTRLLIVSHITSPTAAILPIRQICERASAIGLPVCVDGAHAPAMVKLDLRTLPCDFYAASCHKWLCAPIGTGFLYVRSRYKQGLQPFLISWGKSVMGRPASWKDEFQWPGTFDPTPYLAIPAAIELLQQYGYDRFRTEMHMLCRYARERLLSIQDTQALTLDSPESYGTMATIRLPIPDSQANPNQMHPLQSWLWEQHRIEIPVVRWQNNVHIRVSCHLYNFRSQYDLLEKAVRDWLLKNARN